MGNNPGLEIVGLSLLGEIHRVTNRSKRNAAGVR